MLPSLFKRFLLARALRFEDGRLHLMTIDLMLLPLFVFVDLQKTVQELVGNEKARNIFRELGREHIKTVVRNYKSLKMPIISQRHEALKYFLDFSVVMGYGTFKLKELVPDKYAIIEVKSSIAEEYIKRFGKQNTNVCWYFEGLFEGFAREYYGYKKVDVIEEQCIAKGDPICRFLIKIIEK